MCDDRRFERQRGGGGNLFWTSSARPHPALLHAHAKLGVFEITELWEKEGNRYRML